MVDQSIRSIGVLATVPNAAVLMLLLISSIYQPWRFLEFLYLLPFVWILFVLIHFIGRITVVDVTVELTRVRERRERAKRETVRLDRIEQSKYLGAVVAYVFSLAASLVAMWWDAGRLNLTVLTVAVAYSLMMTLIGIFLAATWVERRLAPSGIERRVSSVYLGLVLSFLAIFALAILLADISLPMRFLLVTVIGINILSALVPVPSGLLGWTSRGSYSAFAHVARVKLMERLDKQREDLLLLDA